MFTNTPRKSCLSLSIASALLLGTPLVQAQTYTGSRTSDANCTDLRANCEAKANRPDARQNTGAAATAGIGAAQTRSSQTTLDAWNSFSSRAADTSRSISDMARENAHLIQQWEEEGRREREREQAQREFLRSPEGKRQYYAARKGKGNAHDDYLYAVYANNDAETVQWMERAAQQGEPRAQYLLAFYKRTGLMGLKADGKGAFDWAAKAAAGGVAQGLGLMARVVYAGESGMPGNDQAAITLSRQGCELHSAEACETLGNLYAEGVEGLPQDLTAARKAYEQAIADEAVPGAHEYGPAAARANHTLAKMYSTGNGVPKDMARARGYLVAATKSSLAILVDELWVTYGAELAMGERGFYGFERNTAEGLRLLNRTGDRGYADALRLLGGWTFNGAPGIEPHRAAGINYFTRAARLQDAESAIKLAEIYIQDKKPVEAFGWVQTAAKLDDPKGLYLQAVYYYKGTGVEQNAALGKASLLKACEAGHANGCNQASQLAQAGGGGFTQDAALAQKLAQRAKELSTAR